jgi:hypothetical protein
MAEVYCIVECLVTYNDGKSEIRRLTYAEVAVGFASVDKISVINYLQENLKNVSSIKVIDTLYFNSKRDYDDYLKAL